MKLVAEGAIEAGVELNILAVGGWLPVSSIPLSETVLECSGIDSPPREIALECSGIDSPPRETGAGPLTS